MKRRELGTELVPPPRRVSRDVAQPEAKERSTGPQEVVLEETRLRPGEKESGEGRDAAAGSWYGTSSITSPCFQGSVAIGTQEVMNGSTGSCSRGITVPSAAAGEKESGEGHETGGLGTELVPSPRRVSREVAQPEAKGQSTVPQEVPPAETRLRAQLSERTPAMPSRSSHQVTYHVY